MTEESIKEYLMAWTGLHGPQVNILVEGLTGGQRVLLMKAIESDRMEAYEDGSSYGYRQGKSDALEGGL